MSSYDFFALYYDSLTKNVDYTGRADYLLSLLQRLNHHAGITLDLACGTGSLTIELLKKGLDIYGIDGSTAMLSVANEKAYDQDLAILFLCQKMQNLDLYGTVNTVFCCLDSINHLKNLNEIQQTFDKISFFMEKDGYFIFDFNTEYKHKNILANNSYVYETDQVYCVWQNSLKENLNKVDISLDFFEKIDGVYHRYIEHFSEITFKTEQLIKMLEKAGFIDIEIFDDMSFEPPKENTQRIVVAAKKKENTNKWIEL